MGGVFDALLVELRSTVVGRIYREKLLGKATLCRDG